MAIPQSQRFQCAVCLDDKIDTPIPIQTIICCKDCLFEQFRLALKEEGQYPVRFGGQILEIDHDAQYLPPAFVHAFKAKAFEYNTAARDRLYCKCSTFLGSKATLDHVTTCWSCTTKTCTCGESGEEHVCGPYTDEGLYSAIERGHLWQRCPNDRCGVIVEQQGGCNHMICSIAACGTEFCFICGEETTQDEDVDHWDSYYGGVCPLYGRSAETRARLAGAVDEPVAEDNDRPRRAHVRYGEQAPQANLRGIPILALRHDGVIDELPES